MKRLIGIFTAAAFCMFPTLALASTWNIDPEHSSIGFKVRHLMVSNVKGSFGKVQGIINIDEKHLTRSNARVTIDTASIDTGVDKRDAHLRSPDFLDVDKFPIMTFVSTNVAKSGKGWLKVTGDLTLHGVTRPVMLEVEELSREGKDPMGNLRRGASATTKISRKDFGIGWNKVLETGGVVVGDEIAISIDIEIIKAK